VSEAAGARLTKYTAVVGTAALRQAIAHDLQSRKGLTYAPAEVVVSNGAKQSVVQALLTIVVPTTASLCRLLSGRVTRKWCAYAAPSV